MNYIIQILLVLVAIYLMTLMTLTIIDGKLMTIDCPEGEVFVINSGSTFSVGKYEIICISIYENDQIKMRPIRRD